MIANISSTHIFKAMAHYHSVNAEDNIEQPKSQALPSSGSSVAMQFAAAATTVLNQSEQRQLEHHFNVRPFAMPSDGLEKQMSQLLEDFSIAEMTQSGLSRTGLARPAGPVNAALGLVLHMQTRKDGKDVEMSQPFWDMDNATIRLLQIKGLSEQSIFAFDWHWRAANLVRGRSNCITTTWKKSLRDLHDKVSLDILDLLPLPFLILAGACPAAQLSKTFSGHTQRVEVPLTQDCTLAFDLLFGSNGLRRIIGYVDHPSAWYFSPNLFCVFSTRLDAMFDLFMWIVGHEHDPSSFSKAFADHTRGYTFSTGMLRGRAVNNHQLRNRLLKGDYFKCTAMKNGTPQGRVFVRNVHILVPPEADFDRVLVRCHLAPQGQQHIERCSTRTISSDVANRLAIEIVYRLRSDHSAITKWCKYQGQVIVSKLNSLVDFLEGKSEYFTATQSRRFQARNKGRGRRKIFFAS